MHELKRYSAVQFRLLICTLQVLVQPLSTQEVSPQLCCLRVDRLVLLCPLEQLCVGEGELSADVLETGTLSALWMPTIKKRNELHNRD